MTSRRAVLSGLGGAGVAGLAGCSALPFTDGAREEREDVSLPADVVEPIEWPDPPFPVAIPSTRADAHRDRAGEFLAAVPTDPSVPNDAIAERLRSDRESAADRLEGDVDEPWPIEGLSTWRSRLNSAATVFGAYRAATGEDDATTVRGRRRTVREALGSFVAGHEYRASSPLEAVLVHAPIEELVADCRHYVRPAPAYPTAPVEEPFRAGDVVGRAELARTTLVDARELRAVYLSERASPPPQWTELIDASDRLEIAVSRARSTVRDFLDVDEPPFDADLEGTAGRWLFTWARGQVEASAADHEARLDDGAYATAVIEAGRTLAAVEALRAAINGIRDGAYQEPVTVESVSRTADRAQDAIAAAAGSEERRLAARILRPALGIFDSVPQRIEEGYADAARVQGDLARVELYARAVPAATAFVSDRLG
jgi:hypothetical protein